MTEPVRAGDGGFGGNVDDRATVWIHRLDCCTGTQPRAQHVDVHHPTKLLDRDVTRGPAGDEQCRVVDEPVDLSGGAEQSSNVFFDRHVAVVVARSEDVGGDNRRAA